MNAARRVYRAAAWASLALLAASALFVIERFWNARLLAPNDNIWRDFPVYRAVGQGLLPLQGPVSSIGGHHGYLAYWIFGLWCRLFPGYRALEILGLLNFGACLAFSWLLAARVASRTSAALGIGVFFCTTMVESVGYPEHILFMPLGAAAGLYGLLRARESGLWPWLAGAGTALLLGSHLYGFAFLAGLLLVDRTYGFGLARRRGFWLPVIAYLLPAVGACLLAPWPAKAQAAAVGSAVRAMDPLLVLRTMPFLHFREEPASLWQLAETAVVAAAWLSAWPCRSSREDRAVLLFYVVNFLLFGFYKYDGQYHLPMFAALPAVLALGLDGAWKRRGAAGGLALAGALLALEAHGAWAKARFSLEDPASPFTSVASDLEAVRVLDELGVGPRTLYSRVWFEPGTEERRLDYLARLYSRAADDPRERRCLRVEFANTPPKGPVRLSVPAGELRVDVMSGDYDRCDNNVRPYEAGAIWYWDLRAGQARLF